MSSSDIVEKNEDHVYFAVDATDVDIMIRKLCSDSFQGLIYIVVVGL